MDRWDPSRPMARWGLPHPMARMDRWDPPRPMARMDRWDPPRPMARWDLPRRSDRLGQLRR